MDELIEKAPKEIQEMQTFLNDINQQRTALSKGTFPGSVVAAIAKLDDFLKVSFKQVLEAHNAHPYIVEAQKKAKEEREALAAAAEEQARLDAALSVGSDQNS